MPRPAILRVEVKPALLRWARDRAGLDPEELAHRFPRFAEWEHEAVRPTLKQLEQFANATHTPIGFLFLPEPPVERVPIPDFRTAGNRRIERPSPDLLDTLYLCLQRQEWYRDFVRSQAEGPLDFVGSVNINSDVEQTAGAMRRALGFDFEERRQTPTWSDSLRRFIEQADTIGVLVMVNGVVGNNNYRKLDPDEFRGFALADGLAPLVFINDADTKAAQMFTLAHELAHIWLGETALSDVGPITVPTNQIERWCNQVAAELLVPLAILRADYQRGEDLRGALDRLARRFKVSTLVILRRIHDAGGLTQWRPTEA
jgi:Zn-dependent peptidase ImmA (M78 family)/transcriptional regulator with XRE-family HTH domain